MPRRIRTRRAVLIFVAAGYVAAAGDEGGQEK